MAIGDSFTTLQAAIKAWLNRTDLDTTGIPEFIELGEKRMRRDKRSRKLLDRTLSVSTEEVTLPTDFGGLEDLYHDSESVKGEIEIVSAGNIGQLKRTNPSPGIPRFAAILDTKFRFVPAPDATYVLQFVYWRKIVPLSTGSPTNWLLTEHSDIYLYASLVESAGFLKDDPRIATWEDQYNKRMEELHLDTDRHQWGGKLVARPLRSL